MSHHVQPPIYPHVGGPEAGLIQYTIQTSAPNETHTLPTQDVGTYEFDADWGDTQSDSNLTTWNDARRTHTYAVPGTYQITLTAPNPNAASLHGIPAFRFLDGGDKSQVISAQRVSDVGMQDALGMWWGCAFARGPLPDMTGCDNVTNAVRMFQNSQFDGVSSLDGLSGVTNANLMFHSAFRIPGVLDFSPMTSLVDATDACVNCWGVTGLVLNGLTNLVGAQSMFQGCTGLLNFPDVSDLGALTNAVEMFLNCNAMAGNNIDLSGMSSLISTAQMFQNCTALTGDIPSLAVCSASIVSIASMFFGCTGLTSAANLIGMNAATYPALTTFNSFMFNNFGIVDALPTFWTDFPAAAATNDCFLNCLSATNYAAVPPAWL